MIKLFSRRAKPAPPQPTAIRSVSPFTRRAMKLPGIPPGDLPFATYDAMVRDTMIQTAMTIKRLAVLANPWKIVPFDQSAASRERADFILHVFSNMQGSPGTILNNVMDAFTKGLSVVELIYRPEKNRITLESTRLLDPSLLGLSLDSSGALDQVVLQLPGEQPQRIPKRKVVVYRNRVSYANPKGQSDLDAAYQHWQAKRTLLAAWKVHLERYASPTVMAKIQRGLPPEDQASILGALENLQDNTAVVFPSEIDVSTLGGNRDQINGFLDAIEFHNREMARSILGQTLTTDEGRRVGSLALGKVHLQVLMLQIASIRKELADVVMNEQVIRPLIDLNFGEGHYPTFEFEDVGVPAFQTGVIS